MKWSVIVIDCKALKGDVNYSTAYPQSHINSNQQMKRFDFQISETRVFSEFQTVDCFYRAVTVK